VIQTEDVDSRMLRRIPGLGKTKEQEDGTNFTRRNFVVFTLHRILPAWSNERE
jgi:hypothetical protein